MNVPPTTTTTTTTTVPTQTIRGSGAYGVVVSPALENTDETGAPIPFPGMVSKIMVHKNVYEKAFYNSQVIQSSIPELHIPINPYQKQFKFQNMSGNVQTKLRQIEPSLQDSSSLYVVRMPDLGVSIHKIIREPQLYRQYRQVPVQTMAAEMLKCMRIVQSIGSKGMIHGDIRDTNVLLNVYTGTMTIIDFDWFMSQENFLKEYKKPYYSFPLDLLYSLKQVSPEYFATVGIDGTPFLSGREKFANYCLQTPPDVYEQFVKGIVNHLIQPQNAIPDDLYYSYLFDKNFYHSNYKIQCIDGFIQYYEVLNNHKNKKDDIIEAFCNRSVETYDSFGLAMTFRLLLNQVLFEPEHETLYNYCFQTLFPKMMHGNVTRRWTIGRAIDEFSEFIRTAYPENTLNEAPSVEQEFARLSAMLELVNGQTDLIHQSQTNQPIHPAQLAQVTDALTNQSGGKRRRIYKRTKQTKRTKRTKQVRRIKRTRTQKR